MHGVLPVSMQDVRRGLAEVELPARFQVLPGRPTTILDVAHNAEAARALAENLGNAGFSPETIAVFGMLRDKDVGAVVAAVAPRITRWHLASLEGPRGASAGELARMLRGAGVTAPIAEHGCPAAAFVAARGEAGENDKIVAFGSFLTVAEVMRSLSTPGDGPGRHG